MVKGAQNNAYKYAAYICYSHMDEAVAVWMHHYLEAYRIPGNVASGYGKRDLLGRRVGRVFRDREELPAGHPLTPNLYQALADSEVLIVLCSPNAAASQYVNDEITEFRRLGKESRIIPVIVDGDPPTCYPAALKQAGENLNADFRKSKDGPNAGVIKVLAGLMNVEPDDLVQRQRRAQRLRLSLAVFGIVLFACLAGATAMGWYQSLVNAHRTEQALDRYFLTNGWQALDHNDPLLAARYALAGKQHSPEDIDRYRSLLSVANYRTGDSVPLEFDTALVLSHFANHDSQAVTATESGIINVWDIQNQRRLFTLDLHEALDDASALSPDGRYVAVTDDESRIRIIDLVERKLLTTFPAQDSSIYSVIFSPDSKRVAMTSADNTASVWTLGGQRVACLAGHTGPVYMVSFSPDGRRVVTSSFDRTVRIWSADDGRQLQSMGDSGSPLMTAEFSPDGRQVIAAGWGQITYIWDAGTGRRIATLSGPGGQTFSATYSPDGRHVITSYRDAAQIWRSDGTLVATLHGHKGPVNSARFSGDGSRTITSGEDRTARVWNTDSGQLVAVLQGHGGNVIYSALSFDGSRALTKSWDHSVRIWSLPGDTPPFGVTGFGFTSASYSPDSKTIISTDYDGVSQVWDAGDHHLIGDIENEDHSVYSTAFSPDGRHVVTAGGDSVARVWNVQDRRLITTLRGHTDSIGTVAFSPDGLSIATASLDSTARIWDAASGKQRLILTHADSISDIAFSSDGKTVVTSGSGFLRIWDAKTGKPISKFETQSEKMFAALSPDGQRVLATNSNHNIEVWNITTRRLLFILIGHTDDVNDAHFSPDGKLILSGGADGTARVWDADDGRLLATLETGRKFTTSSVSFSPDGTQILVTTDKLHVWNIGPLTDPWLTLADRACRRALGSHGRRFTDAEFTVDTLLQTRWDLNRDVCQDVPGVVPLDGATPARPWYDWQRLRTALNLR